MKQLKNEILDGLSIHRVGRAMIAPSPVSSYLDLKKGSSVNKGFIAKFYEYYLFNLFPFYVAVLISQIVKKYGIDIILERETSFGAGAIASMITNRPMVLEVIGPRISKYSLMSAKKVLAYSDLMIKNRVSSKKRVLVSAAVNTDLFFPNEKEGSLIKEKFGLNGSPVVGYVGTFENWHGLEEILNASIMVKKKLPSVKFLMVGPYYESFENSVKKKKMSDSFIFTGPVKYEDVPNYINSADLLLAPYNPRRSRLRSKYGIGSPLKLFEYMACSKPVIAGSVSPITEIIENKRTGILIPPGNYVALEDAIISILNDSRVRISMGKNALKKVRDFYSWTKFTLDLEKILENVYSEETLK